MSSNPWDQYFYSHYHPEGDEWSRKDLEKYRRWYAPWLHYIEHQFNVSFSGFSAVEIGCSIGAVSSLLKERDCQIMGTDISAKMVEHAARLSPDIPFFVWDCMKPFPKATQVEYVFAFEVLEHIPEFSKAMKNIFSLLKPGGLFIGSTPYPYPKNMIDPTHVNVHPPKFWEMLFVEKGFVRVTTRPLSVPPLLWRIPPFISPLLPWYVPWPSFISTTLIVAQKP